MEANDKKVLSKDEQAFYEMLGRAAALPLQMADKYGCIVVACPKGVHVSCVGAPEEILKSDEVPFGFKVFMGLAAVCDKLTGDERRAIFDVVQGATGRIRGRRCRRDGRDGRDDRDGQACRGGGVQWLN